jgi:hypothetical protein
VVDAVQIVGAVLILAAFILSQAKRTTTDSLLYLTLNLVGAVVLGVVAAVDGDPGFLLLEVVWAGVSAHGLVRRGS